MEHAKIHVIFPFFFVDDGYFVEICYYFLSEIDNN